MSHPCLRCDGDMEIRELEFTDTVKDEEVIFTAEGLYCECGETAVAGSQLNDYYRKRSDAYRERHGLLTTRDFLEIRVKLGFSQQAFADMLDVNVRTVKRWETGCVQEKSMDTLVRLKLKEKAEQEGRLPNKIAINFSEETEKISARDVVKYILFSANMSDNLITHMKMQKLLYLTYALFLTYYKKLLFKEKMEAWEHGPVQRDLYHSYKHFKSKPVIEEIREEDITLPEDIRQFIDEVLNSFGSWGASKLRGFSHKDPSWQSAREKCRSADKVYCDEEIDSDDIYRNWSNLIDNTLYRWVIGKDLVGGQVGMSGDGSRKV